MHTSTQYCSAWPQPQQQTIGLFGDHNLYLGPGLLLDLSCLLTSTYVFGKRQLKFAYLTVFEYLLKTFFKFHIMSHEGTIAVYVAFEVTSKRKNSYQK